MLVNIKEESLTKEQKEMVDTLIKSGVMKTTSWADEFVEAEIEYRRENDSEDGSESLLDKTEDIFRECLEENIDAFIDNDELYRTWADCMEKAKEYVTADE